MARSWLDRLGLLAAPIDSRLHGDPAALRAATLLRPASGRAAYWK